MQDFTGLERYEVRRLLGQGGMGTVYEAFDRRRERAVAMKVLKDPEHGSLYRFKREFRAAADLLHPNLVRLFDLGTLQDSGLFFTMELVLGRSLTTYSSSSTDTRTLDANKPDEQPAPLERAEIVRLLAGILEGLSFLHQAKKVHRDLKPANVMV